MRTWPQTFLQLSVLSLWVLQGAPGGRAEEVQLQSLEQPVEVFVIVSKAELLSGPGKDYYPTAFLDRGTALEVHRKTSDGWLATRPPQGSFSWIRANQAYLLPGGKVIEITDDEAVSWIGTDLGTAKHYRWQVELDVGEQLVVIGESTQKDAEGNEALWYKVAPPAGEFRWIQESAVSKKRPAKDEPTSADKQSSSKPAAQRKAKSVASGPSSSTDSSTGVVTANYQESSILEDVFDQGQSVEQIAPGEIIDGTVVEGEVYLDEYYDEGMPYYEEGIPVETMPTQSNAIQENSGSAFGGWHAFDFDDDGLHLTILERMLGERGPMIDPLERDPFSLAMPVRNTRPPSSRIPAGVIPRRTGYETGADSGYQAPRPLDTNRPWRDPRSLRQNRLSGYTDLGLDQRSPQSILSGIRDSVNQLGSRFRGEEIPGQPYAQREEAVPPSTQQAPDNRGLQESQFSMASTRADIDGNSTSIDWYGVKQPNPSGSFGPNSTSPTRTDLSISAELDQLQVKLSEMVTRPPALWNLAPIKERAQYFIRHGETPVERGQARLLMERIDEFEEHARRSAFVPGANLRAGYQPPPTTGFTPRAPTSVSTASFRNEAPANTVGVSMAGHTSPAGPQASLASNQPFDATGWLVSVYASSPGQPSHALTDQHGRVVAYVTGLPGMNLDTKLNQPVGVTGLRGYLPQLQKPHIQAERIVRL